MSNLLTFSQPKRQTAATVRALAKQRALLQTPTGFSKGVLGHSIWYKQREIMEDVANYRRVAVKSCNASGKTFLAADLTLWWISVFPDAIAITTASTWTQVDQSLWGEIRASVNNPRTTIRYPKVTGTRLQLDDKNYALGISTNEATRFHSFHAKKILIIMDEAPGIRPEIWEASSGLRAGGDAHLLIIGNPTIVGGEFNDAFTTKRNLYRTHTICAFDTPNLLNCSLEFDDATGRRVRYGKGKSILEMTPDELDHNVRPSLVTRRWVREQIEEWGFLHPFFQSRILGDFPTQGDDALVPLSWLEMCKVKEMAVDPKDRIRAGLDVAGPGEAETVLTVMRGNRVLKVKGWPQSDPRGEVIAELGPYKEELESLNVDSIGIGWGMYLHLKDIFGQAVHPVNVGEPARDKKKFVNSKAEHFWTVRMLAKDGELLGLDDEKTIGQLSAIRYSHNSKGLIEIESKDELRKRGVKSPDRAESLMLCCARPKSAFGGFVMDPTGGSGSGAGEDGLSRPSGWRMGGGSGRQFGGES